MSTNRHLGGSLREASSGAPFRYRTTAAWHRGPSWLKLSFMQRFSALMLERPVLGQITLTSSRQVSHTLLRLVRDHLPCPELKSWECEASAISG